MAATFFILFYFVLFIYLFWGVGFIFWSGTTKKFVGAETILLNIMEHFRINDIKVYLELTWLAEENGDRVYYLVKDCADPVYYDA